MKRIMTLFFSLAAAAVVSLAAQGASAAEGPAYSCRLHGDISGASIGIIVGGQYVSGDGLITCESTSGGRIIEMPVRLKLIGAGWGLNWTVIKSMEVVSAGVGVMSGPEALLQTFSLGATAGATLGNEGIDFDVAVKLSGEGGLAFEVGFRGKEAVGLGARLHAMILVIEPR